MWFSRSTASMYLMDVCYEIFLKWLVQIFYVLSLLDNRTQISRVNC